MGSLFPVKTVFAQQDPIIRINSGTTTSEVTSEGVTFIADTYFTSSNLGPAVTVPISGTFNDAIYQTERIANENLDPFGYTIPVPANGTYSVTLHFAEIAFQSNGQRVFDVLVEGATVLNDYDIHAAAAGSNTAVVENILNVNVSDGVLDIQLLSVTQRAKISAIEVFGTVATKPIPFGLNAGGAQYSSGGSIWVEDDGTYFLEGTPFTKEIAIDGTTDDDLFKSERFETENKLRFLLPGMAAGRYTIELYFAETFHTASGQRIFDVAVEGNTVLDNYDIFAAAGGANTAVIETFEGVDVTDGILNITLTRVTGSATIHALAITNVSLVAKEDSEALELPGSHQLGSAYPNPFNPQTQFTLDVAQMQQVQIAAYNVLGQRVATIFDGVLSAQQTHAFTFDAANHPGGIYLIQVRGERFVETQHVVLLK
jgi:hypothetical protein